MTKRDVARLVFATLLILFSLFAFLCLATRSDLDPAWDLQNYSAKNQGIRNCCGLPGAYLAGLLCVVFGRTSYLLIFLLGAWGVEIIARGRVKHYPLRLVGGVMLMASAVTIAATRSAALAGQSAGFFNSAGGYVGYYLWEKVLLPQAGSLRGHLVLFVTTIVALVLITDLRFIAWLGKVTAFVLGAFLYFTPRPKRETGELPPPEVPAAPKFPPPPPARTRAALEREGRTAESAARSASPPASKLESARMPLSQRLSQLPPLPSAPVSPPPPAPEPEKPEKVENPSSAPSPEAVAASSPSPSEPSEAAPPSADEATEESEPPPASPPDPGAAASSRRNGPIIIGLPMTESGVPTEEPVGVQKTLWETEYTLPPVRLFEEGRPLDLSQQEGTIRQNAVILETTLKEFGIEAHVVEIQRGPVITQYELSLAPGIRVGRIIGLSDDIAMAVKAPSVRVVAPVPGKSTVGVEVPNTLRGTVRMRELLDTYNAAGRRVTVPLMLGKDAAGTPIISDLSAMPHLLIAGATGSGKSVCINAAILSILMTQHPNDVKLLLVDPKMVELACFKDIPHLMCPVVSDMKKAAAILEWACRKMDERYELLSLAKVRNITQYNDLGTEEVRRRLMIEEDVKLDDVPLRMPYVVIVVDELADLMMVAAKEVETSVTRLSQKSRAVGIHIILATQRPSVDVVTGLIKANMPSRIAFHMSSKVDSRTILDQNGAEKLLGMGDMLFLPPGSSKLIRAQGTLVTEEEIKAVVDYLKAQSQPEFSDELVKHTAETTRASADERDELYEDAVRVVLANERGSVSLLQRKLEIGYSRAARLIDMMAEAGIVGDYKGSQARECLMSLEQWEAMQAEKEKS